jgi:AcrR family transcriptional regulator
VTAPQTDAQDASGRRRYRSQLRGQQAAATKQAVVDAATELFAANGWQATGMREVAAAAGVAIETVYSHFSSKRGLLLAVVDAAVVGDDAPVPLAERAEFLAIGQGRRPARIRAAARLLTGVQVRTAAIAVLLRQAAPADAEIAELLHATRERQRVDVGRAVEMIIGRAPTAVERDGVWAIASPEVYLLLVDGSGWTPEQYEAWVADTLERVIPRS